MPIVTASFWILKILTTGMGEAASDALVRAFGGVAVAATGVALVAGFAAQFRAPRYVPGIYWLAVAMVGVFGTMAADLPHFGSASRYLVTSAVFLLAVLAIFGVWFRLEGTLSFSSITGGRREAFYWAAVVATFALGTAVGDLTARHLGLGYLVSGLLFAALIALPALARGGSVERGPRLLDRLRPHPPARRLVRRLDGHALVPRGPGIEMALVAALWALAIAGFVTYLAMTRRGGRVTVGGAPHAPDLRVLDGA